MLKLYHYGKPLESESEQPPLGFEHTGLYENFMEANCVCKTLEYGVYPLEEGEFRTQVSAEVEAPPGFEIKISNVAGGVCQAAEGSRAKVLNAAALGNGECQGELSDVNPGYPPGFETHVSPSV